MTETVLYELHDRIAVITLNRPHRLNAINETLLSDVLAALKNANADPKVGCILIKGAGRAFCAGDDLKEFESQARDQCSTETYVRKIQDITRELVLNNKMVVGAIHGWAVGGGFEWVINCDLVVAARETKFFFPEVGLGVFVTGAVTALLPQIVGPDLARRMILFGEHLTAEDAVEMGFDWELCETSELVSTAIELARKIANLPPIPVSHLKRILRQVPAEAIEHALDLEMVATIEGFLDPDTRARVAAAISDRTQKRSLSVGNGKLSNIKPT